MFKEHEKFLAFLALLISLVWLSWMSNTQNGFVMVDGKPVTIAAGTPLRDAIVGIIGILGMAAQALFRVSETAKEMNELLRTTVEKLGNSTPITKKGVPEDVKAAADQVAGAAQDEADSITEDSDSTSPSISGTNGGEISGAGDESRNV